MLVYGLWQGPSECVLQVVTAVACDAPLLLTNRCPLAPLKQASHPAASVAAGARTC